jgi:hypothetical protein
MTTATLLPLLMLLPAAGTDAEESAERAALIGSPESITVAPAELRLTGRWAEAQFVVTARYADGSARDLTAVAEYAPADAAVAEVRAGYVTARADGQTEIAVSAGGKTVRVPVTVAGRGGAVVPVFRHQVIAALNVSGCNAGACHGTPSGKNGFRLSLRGSDPDADHARLAADKAKPRVDPADPDASLVLRKGRGELAHEGGKRFGRNDLAYRLLRGWIAGGAPADPADLPTVAKLEILTGPALQHAPAKRLQLAAVARFGDGSSADVTRLTVFTVSDDSVAKVDARGRLEFAKPGEVAVLARYLETLVTVRLTHLDPPPGYRWPDPPPPEANVVDRHVFAKLRFLGIPPSDLAGDAEFLRRASLDICGVLPEPEEVRAFLADKSPDKRTRLVDRLLARPEYADHWALKWADVLGNNRRALQAKGAYLFHRWLRDRIAAGEPLDRLARTLLTATGSTFDNPPAGYHRAGTKARDADAAAQAAAQVWMGVRISCAKCHNHPFERWTQDDYYGLAAFFARVRGRPDELNTLVNRFNQGGLVIELDRSGEVLHPRTGKPQPPRFPGGVVPAIPEGADRRDVLADWLTAADNPFFARSVANRIWFHLVGRGVVDAPDDFRDSNPPASDELLDALAAELVAARFDARALIRLIATSRTYQLSGRTDALNAGDERYFSHAVTRLLPAEVLLDALSSATGSPEPFPGQPLGTRAVQLPDGDALQHPFLAAFGQPARETSCECERGGDAGLGHALQLVNGPTLRAKLSAPDNRLGRLLAGGASDAQIAEVLYLATLSRPPTDPEAKAVLEHVSAAGRTSPDDRRRAWEDVQWALLNSKEFLFRH